MMKKPTKIPNKNLKVFLKPNLLAFTMDKTTFGPGVNDMTKTQERNAVRLNTYDLPKNIKRKNPYCFNSNIQWFLLQDTKNILTIQSNY